MEILVMLGQFSLALAILVGIHEAGHMLAAKLFGMRVEKFFIGFPPKIFTFKKGETEYGLGLIPLGGFVKISGMIDESMDTEQMKQEPQPYEFRAKPAWQRLIVMLGGIIMNVILGILIFVFTLFFYGDSYESVSEMNKKGMATLPLGKEIGLQDGDKLIKVNGQPVERLKDAFAPQFLLADNAFYTVEREGQAVDVKIPEGFINKYSDNSRRPFIAPQRKFKIADVTAGSNAEKAGVQKNDIVLAVDSAKIEHFYAFLSAMELSKEKKVNLTLLRGSDTLRKECEVTRDGTIGIKTEMLDLEGIKTDYYSFGTCINKGTVKAFETVWIQLLAFKRIFSGEIDFTKALSGPIGMTQMFGGTWDWQRFWGLTGLISMVLAFMNLLPIPALDGGHVVFLLFEMISGRKPSDKFQTYAQIVGFVIIGSLIVLAFGTDIYNLIKRFF